MLRTHGVLIALDDFGTGFSSLNLLRRLPIDIIKIDRAFIAEITQSGQDRELARQIIRIAIIFHRTVIAEGVTSTEEMTLLREFGCHCVQGFGIAHPLPPTDFANLVNLGSDPRKSLLSNPNSAENGAADGVRAVFRR
jgi:diguanylate cyclase